MNGRPVEAGTVWCPLRDDDVALDACFECGLLRSLAPDRTWMSCHPPRRRQESADWIRAVDV